ncbi:MAG: hypothetical protein ACR2LQ_14450 [Acidimicrobiales bacterium]
MDDHTVETLTVADPAAAAPAIAEERGAELVSDERAARAAVSSRQSGRTAVGSIDELAGLGEELARAQRMRARSEDAFRDVMVPRLARAAGLDPAATRPSSADPLAEPVGPRTAPFEQGYDAERMRLVGLGLAVSSVGVGLMLGALNVAVPVAAGVAVGGVVVSAAIVVRANRAAAAKSRPASKASKATSGAPRGGGLDVEAARAASPTLKAVAAVHRRAAARWRVGWAGVGYAEPPGLEQLDRELARMRSGAPRPMVLVEPAAWVAPGQLGELLDELPDETPVTIVQRAPST